MRSLARGLSSGKSPSLKASCSRRRFCTRDAKANAKRLAKFHKQAAEIQLAHERHAGLPPPAALSLSPPPSLSLSLFLYLSFCLFFSFFLSRFLSLFLALCLSASLSLSRAFPLSRSLTHSLCFSRSLDLSASGPTQPHRPGELCAAKCMCRVSSLIRKRTPPRTFEGP